MTPALTAPLEETTVRVPDLRARLEAAMSNSAAAGFDLRGQLLRPAIAHAAWRGGRRGSPPATFWNALVAIQLAHEASLVHDDIVDSAPTRRGEPSVATELGVGAAVVQGDQLLTGAYRHAAATGSIEFCERFAEAVDQTVAGEVAQACSAGSAIGMDEYRQIVLNKSGELLGIALASAEILNRGPDAASLYALGRRVGLIYQMVDDLLDYCPRTDTGKAPFADHGQRKWTWVLATLPPSALDDEIDPVATALRTHAGGIPPLARCLAELDDEIASVARSAARLLRDPAPLLGIIREWRERAALAVTRELEPLPEVQSHPSASARLKLLVPSVAEQSHFISSHSRSFRFASRFFPSSRRSEIERLYAFCRVTDDIGDGGNISTADRFELLNEWETLARKAYDGNPSGFPILDHVMGDSAAKGVPFTYAEELIEGMRMDLRGVRYETFASLDRYCYRVASVVGLWITELAGVRDQETLAAAATLGRAMQITNIARDVGEDLERGRLYIPAELLAHHGVSVADLHAQKDGDSALSDGIRQVIEDMLATAEADYRSAIPAIIRLPRSYRAPVSIAAHVYQDIHRSIRRNGHDTLRVRAFTGPVRKAALALVGLGEVAWHSLLASPNSRGNERQRRVLVEP